MMKETGKAEVLLKAIDECQRNCKAIIALLEAVSSSIGEDTEFEITVQHQKSLEERVSEAFKEIGIPAHIKGYQYARYAIMCAKENPETMNSMTKILYPTVAKHFDTKPSRVERAIRHAIEVAWDRGNMDVLERYFGYTIDEGRGKPTNSEFIAMIVDNLRLEDNR